MAVSERTIHLKITGMTCDGCVRTVEEALRSVEGVGEVEVNLEKGLALVKATSADLSVDKLIMAVKLAGYGAREIAG